MLTLNSVLAVASVSVFPAETPTNDQVQEAVQRSIPYIEKRGEWWIEKKECVSCHRVNNMVWTLSAARQNGFEVSDKLDEWREWAADSSLAKNDKGKIVGLANKEGVAQLVLSFSQNAKHEGTRQKLVALLLNDQQPDGSWKPGGQLPTQKRPKPETASISTMWLALALLENGSQDKTATAIEGALKFIQQSPRGKSTEWYTTQLLLAIKRNDQEQQDQWIQELRKQQQADGGWGWLVCETSDALGTGMAVYALTEAGINRDDPSIQQARQFLVSTQRDDGSWAVQGTKANKKDKIQETATYWGTTWATLGLIASLPDQPE